MTGRLTALASAAISTVLLALFGSTTDAPAGGGTILYAFQGGMDGAEPVGALVTDKDGNLYGTTSLGKTRFGGDHGTIFEIAADGTKSTLSYFNRQSGENPANGLLRDKHGNLYGTTPLEGNYSNGTVYELPQGGKIRALYSFDSVSNGISRSNLIADAAGNLYGTTAESVFRLASDGTFTTLHTFRGGKDGEDDISGLIFDEAGNLWGTTIQGGGKGKCGVGCGTVFKIATDGTETVVHAFAGGSDGRSPEASLVSDGTGNLYGTTSSGGHGPGCSYGCGTVFKIAPDGT